MAGAIAYYLLVALFPLLVLGIGILGFVLASFGDPTQYVLDLITQTLPVVDGADLAGAVEDFTRSLQETRTEYTLAGSVFLLWIATRLSGSLRVALREIFDIGVKRDPIRGKIFDVGVVLVGLVLLATNLGLTFAVSATIDVSSGVFALRGVEWSTAERLVTVIVSFASIWVLLFLLYRYLPPRVVAIRTAVVAATFTAVSHESLKLAFSWYATEVANYSSMLGNLTTVAVLFFWIYYEALVFILGGEVAQVYTMRKASRVGMASFDEGHPIAGHE